MTRAAKKTAKKPAAKASVKRPPKVAKKPAKKKGARPAPRKPARKVMKAKPRAKRVPQPEPAVPAETPTPAAATPVQPIEPIQEPPSDAIPQPIGIESSDSARRSLSARERALRSLPVVEILDDPHPIGALRRFLDSIKGKATPQQAQIALDAAALMLMPSPREHRGNSDVKELVDLVLEHWDQFGERRKGYHAQEFLKSAFLAIGVDRERIQKLEDRVPPSPSADLLFTLACAHAVARDKVAMLRAVERALDAGTPAAQFRRDADFLVYANDPDLSMLLTRAEVPQIPVDIDPHVPGVRAALDQVVATLVELGLPIELKPPVRLDAVLDAERARKISLPNDYRALLAITNGMTLWQHVFFAAGDYREMTPLALSAQRYMLHAAQTGALGVEESIPIARWGTEMSWLLYDPRGRMRGGEPGYVLRLDHSIHPIPDLVSALARIEETARETLGSKTP